VLYSGGMISVNAVTNSVSTTIGVLTVPGAGYQFGDTMAASVDQTGLVTVTQNGTIVGSVQLPAVPLWTTGIGHIGMELVPGAMVDNFAGGNF
jgi:hypothetical protein